MSWFFLSLCVVFPVCICAASSLFRTMWLAWDFSSLCWACTQHQPGICLSQLCNRGPSSLSHLCDRIFTDNASGCEHCLLLQINWAPFVHDREAANPYSLARPNETLNSPRLGEDGTTQHRMSQILILIEIQHFLKHYSFEIVVCLWSVSKTLKWVVCVNFVQLYICCLGI